MPPADGCSLSYQLLLNVFVVVELFLYFPQSPVLMADEQLKCNICEVTVSASQAKHHASTSSHESRRAGLEQELSKIRKESYKNDSSVIVQWESSTSR
jgi:hypothetical protein